MAENPNSNTFIFESVPFQNAANTVFNHASNYDAVNNAVVTGNTYKYRSDFERMQAITGRQGFLRPTGYYNYLVTTFFNMTIRDGITIPSNVGPGNTGWGVKIGSAILNPNSLNDAVLQKYTGQSDYVLASMVGYIYSPVATTIQIQVTVDDGVELFLNGTRVLNQWIYQGPTTYTTASLTLNAGYNAFTAYFFEGEVTCIFTMAFSIGGKAFTQDGTGFLFHNYKQL